MAKTKARREVIFKEAFREAGHLSSSPLWCVGVALYFGEGGKTQNMTRISNSDPAVIKIMMKFFIKICQVDKSKFRGHVHTFDHCDSNRAESYWSKVSGIDRSKFFKTYKKVDSLLLFCCFELISIEILKLIYMNQMTEWEVTLIHIQ